MAIEFKYVENYEILNSFRIGMKTIVIGENANAEKDERYICSYMKVASGIPLFTDDHLSLSDNYLEILKNYTELLRDEILKMEIEINHSEIPYSVITEDDCYENDYTQNITGKIVAVKREVFYPEYQRAECQICIVSGGVGAEAYARGETLNCINLCDGSELECGRDEIIGVIKPECMPSWVENYMLILQPDERVFEYNKRHYIFCRNLSEDEIEDLYDSVVLCVEDDGYEYREFCKNSENEKLGLYLCLENNKKYVPCEKWLLLWMGD